MMKKILIVSLMAFFLLSVFQAMRSRTEARRLTDELLVLRGKTQQLRDSYRNLRLEYLTFANYGKIRQQAEQLGMIEPSLEAGTLVYLREVGQQ